MGACFFLQFYFYESTKVRLREFGEVGNGGLTPGALLGAKYDTLMWLLKTGPIMLRADFLGALKVGRTIPTTLGKSFEGQDIIFDDITHDSRCIEELTARLSEIQKEDWAHLNWDQFKNVFYLPIGNQSTSAQNKLVKDAYGDIDGKVVNDVGLVKEAPKTASDPVILDFMHNAWPNSIFSQDSNAK